VTGLLYERVVSDFGNAVPKLSAIGKIVANHLDTFVLSFDMSVRDVGNTKGSRHFVSESITTDNGSGDPDRCIITKIKHKRNFQFVLPRPYIGNLSRWWLELWNYKRISFGLSHGLSSIKIGIEDFESYIRWLRNYVASVGEPDINLSAISGIVSLNTSKSDDGNYLLFRQLELISRSVSSFFRGIGRFLEFGVLPDDLTKLPAHHPELTCSYSGINRSSNESQGSCDGSYPLYPKSFLAIGTGSLPLRVVFRVFPLRPR